jgi:predicted RNase H-like nuclease (RuvC/YqgF family)
MQNEGLQSEIKEKQDHLEAEKTKNQQLYEHNLELFSKVEYLQKQKDKETQAKNNEIDKLKSELELLKSHVKALTSTVESKQYGAAFLKTLDLTETTQSSSTNVFDQI